MRSFLHLVTLLMVPVAASCSAQTALQPFVSRLAAQASASPQTITIIGQAEWVAGSLHASGSATLKASADGSAAVSLALDKFAATENFGPWSMDRVCSRNDADGKVRQIEGMKCLAALPWFLPGITGPGRLPSFISSIDSGEVPFGDTTLHKISYVPAFPTTSATKARLLKAASLSMYYDPVTLQVTALEYNLHPDGDDVRSIPVTVIFSDFRIVNGFTVPFHIDRYANGVKQLSVQANTVSAN